MTLDAIKATPGYRLLAPVGAMLVLLQFVIPSGNGRQAAAFLLLWIIPGLLWALWLRGASLERLLGGSGLALLLPIMLTLAASYIPGALPRWALALISVAAPAAPLVALAVRPSAWSERPEYPVWSNHHWPPLLLILLLAAALRLVNADYKEFQGDEGVIMVRAAQALSGDEMALLRHQKGPVEILLPLLPWGLGGSINEFWSRAVFVWAGWLVVPAIAVLGARWFKRSAALIVALLFAINGFAIAFSRIVQYQSLVLLWTVLSLIFAHRYRQKGGTLDLILSACFLAAGLVAHYDAILAAPAVAWLIVARWRSDGSGWFRQAIPALVAGGTILALFYVPYVANPTFSSTGSYLLADRIGGLFSLSISDAWRMATFYNSSYYVIILLLLAAAGIAAARRAHDNGAAVLLLATPLLFYTLVVADPRTHVYTIFPGLTLLAGDGAAFIWNKVRVRAVRATGLFLFMLVVAASLLYVYLLFVDVTPERQRTWSENRPPYFPTTWSNRRSLACLAFRTRPAGGWHRRW